MLCGRFLQEMTDAVERCVDWAERTVREWPDDLSAAEPDLTALEAMALKDRSGRH